MLHDFGRELASLDDQKLHRRLRVVESPADTAMRIAGRQLISMASNNYLGLANHPAVKQAAISAIERWGVGSGAARLISGSMAPHHDLEDALARFKQVQAVLTLGSGYTTNIGLIPSLVDQNGLVLADRYSHASLIEGIRLAGATFRVFQHNDVEHLERLLKKRKSPRPTLVVTEGVFSMDGDLAPLPELVRLCQEYEASLLVDDAHGTGVMGENGRGTLEHFGLDPANVVQMGTMSKALGVSGGYVAGTAGLTDYLVNTAKSFIFSTASPPAIAAAGLAALSVIRNEPERRKRLWTNREFLFTELTRMGLNLTDTQSPILPILVNTPEAALKMSQALFEEGVFVPAIRPPTVPKGSSRLRLTVSSEHTMEQLEKVVCAFRTCAAG